MEIKPEVYEQPGTFYLGREYDIATKALQDNLVLYDSKDLVTHGVVLGMTGSGKTGLCLALLEEAAMDGIPVIAIDPKGDIANFLLQFPNLEASEFEPWVNPEDAQKKGQSVGEYAAGQAQMWTKGLGDWGQSADRIKKLREKVDVNIFTPGSSAGIPVSILASLAAPAAEIIEDAEIFHERVESCATSLISLAGVEGDPVQSPQHILLANIFTHCWGKGQDVTLESLVHLVQQPPFDRVGVVAVDEFLSEKKRTEVAMKLNNLIASPSFASWLQGVPLDIQRMLYTPEGKPRVSIFSIAHLSDEQRMFFVSLLLNETLGWMRMQSGTTSLRAMLYMDEIYGYLPPTANPPSKRPMMILLKQARAFGLGILLATQNPVDLDYKALSNIGSWFLGRLQTERDKARVLDGLEGAATSQNAKFDRGEMENLLSALGNRVFLMNNVHEDHPVVFNVRWVMTYLRGPLSRNQIKSLVDPKREAFASLMQGTAAKKSPRSGPPPLPKKKKDDEDAGFLPPSSDEEEEAVTTSSGDSSFRPKLPDPAVEYFQGEGGSQYLPAMLRCATVLFNDAKKKVNGRVTVTLVNEIDAANAKVNWDKFLDVPRDIDLATLSREPEADASFGELPSAAQKAATWKAIAKDLTNWIYANYEAEVRYSPLLEAYSNLGESEADFRVRVSQVARELRDKAVEELRDKMVKQAKSIEDKAARAMQKVETQQAQASSAKWSTAAGIGGSILGALFGRKRSVVSATNVSRVGSIFRESREAASAEQEVERYREELKALDQQLADETQKIRDQYDPTALAFETTKLTPMKKNITPSAVGILWVGK
ncbi:MAG: ATP-binding protein [Roseimicrobium sp.]